MSSSSEKGKSGGKKLSTNKQLLVLQDALTLGVSELQLAARRLGDHWITMSTGNQEKRGAKEAYVKVKVEVTFKSKARLKSVPKLDVETSTSVWEVINFISNFEIKMRSHKVSKGDQKIYLLEALKPGVVRALDMRGVDNSLMDELFEEVRRKVLG